jgi:YebC/PmpR family DNA-binding regulatory protein
MAGHSKWKNIRLRKGKQDAIRGKLFTKLSREIIVAARMGGGDPSMNARLRVAVDKARENSVPVENIKRAIDRGTGAIEGAAYEEIIYEGYGPSGSAIIMKCYSENRNRTVADVRNAFNKNGGSMAENGSVSWQFRHLGQIQIPINGRDEDELTLEALDADLDRTNANLTAAGFKTDEVSITFVPDNKVELSADDQVKLLKLLDALDDLDDVQETYMNVEFSEDALAEE